MNTYQGTPDSNLKAQRPERWNQLPEHLKVTVVDAILTYQSLRKISFIDHT